LNCNTGNSEIRYSLWLRTNSSQTLIFISLNINEGVHVLYYSWGKRSITIYSVRLN